MSWKFIPKKIDDSDVGFIYRVVEKDTNKIYIGIKRFWSKKTKPPLKGKKRKRVTWVESDWKTYNTSSPIMQEKLSSNQSNYNKEIIKVCKSVTELKAYEAYMQLTYYVNGKWDLLYNEVINLRLRIR